LPDIGFSLLFPCFILLLVGEQVGDEGCLSFEVAYDLLQEVVDFLELGPHLCLAVVYLLAPTADFCKPFCNCHVTLFQRLLYFHSEVA
jgi:hypothetical protein